MDLNFGEFDSELMVVVESESFVLSKKPRSNRRKSLDSKNQLVQIIVIVEDSYLSVFRHSFQLLLLYYS